MTQYSGYLNHTAAYNGQSPGKLGANDHPELLSLIAKVIQIVPI